MVLLSTLNSSANAPFWIDVEDPSPEDLEALSKEHKLHPALIRDCLDPIHHPKFERVEETRFLILRHADFEQCKNPEADTIRELTRKLAIFILEDGIISVHRSEQPWIKDLFLKWEKRGLKKKTELPHVFNNLVMGAIFSFIEPLSILEENFEACESRLLAKGKKSDLIEELYFLKRKVTVYKKMLQASLDALSRMDIQSYKNSPYHEDLIQEGNRQHFHADELTDDVHLLLQTQLSLASHRTNEVMRVLTLFSVFFLPLTFIVGIYGMNFKFMPELEWQWGYPTILFIMVVITLGIGTWFRKKEWL